MSQTTSSNFSIAREAMVVSQLYPSGIINEDVLSAYRSVPRERFVPADRQTVCYLDDDVTFSNGRVLIEPLVHALMIENAQIQKTDKVLDIGGMTGYSGAVIAQLAKAVVAVEQDVDALEFAKNTWLQMGLLSIMPVNAAHNEGCPPYGPYDVIIFNGAVASIPQTIQDQLAPQGRLLCIERKPGSSGQIRLYIRQGSQLSGVTIADAGVPYLPGLEPTPSFVF